MRSLYLSVLLIAATLLGTLPTFVLPTIMPIAEAMPLAQSSDPEPLPRGCGNVTPPGDELAACCISGFVYIDGKIVAGAEVTIISPRGNSVVFYTQVYSGTDSVPYYRLSLSAPPLEIKTGETITVTARYSSHEQSLSYIVQPGSQMVDVVLERTFANDYVFEQQIRAPSTQYNFHEAHDIASTPTGGIALVDRIGARIQIFSSDMQLLNEWGSLGSLPGQLNTPGGIAVDEEGNIYIADTGNHRVQKFDRQGHLIAQWGGRGSGPSQMIAPSSVAVDRTGNIFVFDAGNYRVQKLTSTGAFANAWGTKGSNQGQFDGEIVDIVVDSKGFVYVAESGLNP
ncbi:MAG: hypothetical protein WCI67_01175 [Chloroflexales bacterium]